MVKPLVSLCIPVRNTERWLRQAVDSALGQTWPACEVVVVDDGSTDGTRGILESYGSRITWRSTPPLGGNAARNLALSLSRGEWIQFLDADDYLLPDKLESQWDETGAFDGADLILSPEFRETWREDRALQRIAQEVPDDDDLFGQWLLWQWPGTQGGLWRRKVLETLGGWDESVPCCQDYELYARALRHGVAIRWTKRPLSVYRIWSEQTVCRRDPKQLIEVKTRLIDAMVDYLQERGQWSESLAAKAGQTCFEMCRTLAGVDLALAQSYYAERMERGLIRLDGPAANGKYRLAHRLFGFKNAERLARVLR